MTVDPIALVNAAPATALCVLVYLELRQQRATQRTFSEMLRAHGDTLTAVQSALDLLAQLLGVKLRRKTTPHGLPILPPSED